MKRIITVAIAGATALAATALVAVGPASAGIHLM